MKMPEGILLSDGEPGVLSLLILNERVGDIVFFLLQDDEFYCAELTKLTANVILLDLNGQISTDLLILEM